jgi:hypothetical protein
MEISVICLVSVIVGFVMGRMTVSTPKPVKRSYKVIKSPTQAIKEYKLTKEQEKEIAKYTTILENVENYDGTGSKQRNVPL